MTYRILSIETSSEFCSLALSQGEETLTRTVGTPQQHSLRILPLIEELMKEGALGLKQLDAIAVGQGPGSFTGVRLGLSVAQGLCAGLTIPCIPVSTLAILACAAKAEAKRLGVNYIIPCMDARMQEVYGALYEITDDELIKQVEPFVQTPSNVSLQMPQAFKEATPFIGVGTGWQDAYLPELLQSGFLTPAALLPHEIPNAVHLAYLAKKALKAGESYAPEDCLPAYCRDKVVF